MEVYWYGAMDVVSVGGPWTGSQTKKPCSSIDTVDHGMPVINRQFQFSSTLFPSLFRTSSLTAGSKGSLARGTSSPTSHQPRNGENEITTF